MLQCLFFPMSATLFFLFKNSRRRLLSFTSVCAGLVTVTVTVTVYFGHGHGHCLLWSWSRSRFTLVMVTVTVYFGHGHSHGLATTRKADLWMRKVPSGGRERRDYSDESRSGQKWPRHYMHAQLMSFSCWFEMPKSSGRGHELVTMRSSDALDSLSKRKSGD